MFPSLPQFKFFHPVSSAPTCFDHIIEECCRDQIETRNFDVFKPIEYTFVSSASFKRIKHVTFKFFRLLEIHTTIPIQKVFTYIFVRKYYIERLYSKNLLNSTRDMGWRSVITSQYVCYSELRFFSRQRIVSSLIVLFSRKQSYNRPPNFLRKDEVNTIFFEMHKIVSQKRLSTPLISFQSLNGK